jgi:hypothetical protein
VNAAFLLVTTAWLAGADQPAPPAAPVANPPAASSSCCGDCGGGCGHGFLERLHGLFHHDGCCETACKPSCAKECKPTCVKECKPKCVQECKPKCVQECKPKCVKECKPACEKSCCDSCRPRLLDRLRDLFHHDCCDHGCKGGCGSSCDSCRHGLFARLRDWFHNRHCCQDSCCDSGHGTVVPGTAEPIAPPKDAPKKMPSPKEVQNLTPTPSFAPANTTIETETKSPFELNRRYVSRVDRAPDYSWLTGQLFYVHADGGLWVLRYAPLWKEDPNGGSMVLARDLRMDSFREGDLVTVHGEIISQHGSEFLGGPLYQVHSIKLVERSGE